MTSGAVIGLAAGGEGAVDGVDVGGDDTWPPDGLELALSDGVA